MPALDHRAGLVLVVLSALCFAATPSLARLAYEGGSDPATAALFRFAVGFAMLFAAHRLRGGRLVLDRRLALIGLGTVRHRDALERRGVLKRGAVHECLH